MFVKERILFNFHSSSLSEKNKRKAQLRLVSGDPKPGLWESTVNHFSWQRNEKDKKVSDKVDNTNH